MFIDKENELFEKLGENQIMVLATSKNDTVTARSLSFIIFDKRFYFQTDITMMKADQIAANSKVAICCSNFQIEGICKETGHPFEERNKRFTELYKKHYEGSFSVYSHMKNERVFVVIPGKITVWDYDNGNPFRDFYDLKNKTYKREYYKTEC